MFRTLRLKLLFSYAAVAVICLVLALLVMLALANEYAVRTGYRVLEEKWSLAMPLVRIALTGENRRQTAVSRQVLAGVQDAIRGSGVRVLLVNPDTLTVVEDTSSRYDAQGERFTFDVDDAELARQLGTAGGTQGFIRFEGEPTALQYVARRIRLPRIGDQSGQSTGSLAPYIVVLAQPQPRLLDALRGDLRGVLVPAGFVALAASLLVALLLARSISRPVAGLARATDAMARGDYSQRVPVRGRDELATLSSRFNAMAEEVDRAHRAQRDFVANVSHDLKTPLTSIQGFSQAVLDGAITDEQGYRQAAGIINAEAERMSRLVNELLTLTRLESGLSALDLRPVDVEQVVREQVLAMQPQAAAAGVSLSLSSRAGQLTTPADPDRLKQALGNLVDNALKYTRAGGSVLVDSAPVPGGVRISVRDTGRGIPEEELTRVMERFYRVDKARGAGTTGSLGLGLAIAREIVAAHGGTLEIDSRPGEGTTVVVTIPAYSQAAGTPAARWLPWARPAATGQSAVRSGNGSGPTQNAEGGSAERPY
ncbi:MAG TPA: HAMP domain-containing sensor histidine kinase [Chloroflexia bacterium]|nr:HAMP domain-containing sensor histidine kinase [Chloroflexia bacterium]